MCSASSEVFGNPEEVEKRCLARRQIVEEAVALVEEQKSPSDGDMWLVRSSKIVVVLLVA